MNRKRHAEADEFPESKRPRVEDADAIGDEPPTEVFSVAQGGISSKSVSATDGSMPEFPASVKEEEFSKEHLDSSSEVMDVGDGEDDTPTTASISTGQKGDGTFKENPYIYLPQDHPLLKVCLYVRFCPFSV